MKEILLDSEFYHSVKYGPIEERDGEFFQEIWMVPKKSIDFINLNFVVTETGIEFEEVVKSL